MPQWFPVCLLYDEQNMGTRVFLIGRQVGKTDRAVMKRTPTILFAEDCESDMMLIQLGFERAHFPFALQFVPDGIAAKEYLSGEGKYADRTRFPKPCVLLTDLKMPRMDGFELLVWLRSQESWRNLPVIILTGSNQSEDCKRAMNLGANSYVVKELLMRPPPSLVEALLRYGAPGPAADHRPPVAKARKKRVKKA